MKAKKRLSIPEGTPVHFSNRVHDIAIMVMINDENANRLSILENEFKAVKRLDYLFRSDEWSSKKKDEFIKILSETVLYQYADDEYPYNFDELLNRSTGYADYR